MSKKLICGGLLLLLVLMLLSGCDILVSIKEFQAKDAAIKYLEENYEETFVFSRQENIYGGGRFSALYSKRSPQDQWVIFKHNETEAEIFVAASWDSSSDNWIFKDNYIDFYYKEELEHYISRITYSIFGDNKVDYKLTKYYEEREVLPTFSEYISTTRLGSSNWLRVYITQSNDNEENRWQFVDEMENAFPELWSLDLYIVKDGTPLNEFNIDEYKLDVWSDNDGDIDVIRVDIYGYKEEDEKMKDGARFVKKPK